MKKVLHFAVTFVTALMFGHVSTAATSIERLGSWPGYLRGPVDDLVVVNGFAIMLYHGNFVGRLTVFDLRDSSNPVRLQDYEAEGGITRICRDGDRVLVGTVSEGAILFEVTSSGFLHQLGAYNPGRIEGAILQGNIAYLGTTGKIWVTDVSDPANWKFVKQIPAEGPNFLYWVDDTEIFALGTWSRFSAFYAYKLSDGSLRPIDVLGVGGYKVGEYAYRMGNSPQIINPKMSPFDPMGTSFYVGQVGGIRATHMKVAGDLAYFADQIGNGCVIFDVTDPTHPIRLGSWPLPGTPRAIDVEGNKAYVTGGYGGIYIVDVTDPNVPKQVGQFEFDGRPWDLAISGSRAAMCDGTAFRLLDISAPEMPRLLSSVSLPSGLGNPPPISRVGLTEDYMFAGFYDMQVYDISEPQTPIRAESFQIYASGAFVTEGNSVYASWAFPTWDDTNKVELVRVFQMENGQASIVGRYYAGPPNYSVVHGVAVTDNRMYWNRGGIEVFDRKTPPKLLGSTYYTPTGFGLEIVGNTAVTTKYMFNPRALGIVTFDITDSKNPQFLASLDLTNHPNVLTVVGNLACLTGVNAGIQIVDISDPRAPTFVGQFGMNSATSIAAQGNRLFVADEDHGLVVYRLTTSPRIVSYVARNSVYTLDRPIRLMWGSDGIENPSWKLSLLVSGQALTQIFEPAQSDGKGHWWVDWIPTTSFDDSCQYSVLIRDTTTGAQTATMRFCLRNVPRLMFVSGSNEIQFSWEDPQNIWILVTTTVVDGTWIPVEGNVETSNGISTYRENATSGARYFRLQQR